MTWGHREIDVRGRLRRFDLGICESRLQVKNVLSQCIIL